MQDDDQPAAVSTGNLPADADVRAILEEGYERYRAVDEGDVADYIPALAGADPAAFGACVAGVDGTTFSVGDAAQEFSIQSVSKPFVFALVCDALGTDEVRRRIGVNSTGQPFNSVMALEMSADRTTNPMVNAGAIATTSLAPGDTPEEMWQFVIDGLSRFAGRPLSLDHDVYESEAATNRRNQGLAHLLDGYERIYADPDVATDVYTMQCSLRVTAVDLAVMGATLADGGVNPISGERVVDEQVCPRVLAVLATAGLYERTGDWLYDVGLPGKSGVSGGMVTVSPGKGGLGVFSPLLDAAGNSVRARLLTRFLSQRLGLNLFLSQPAPAQRLRVP